MELILNIWLGDDVPTYTAGFCRMILICTLFDATTGVFNTAITATGKIKFYQLWISLSFLLDLGCSYLMLFARINPVLVFSSRILTRGVLNMIIGLYFSRRYIGFDISGYCKTTLFKIFIILLVTIIPTYCISLYTDGWLRFIYTTLFSSMAIVSSTLYILMNEPERNTVLVKLKKRLVH